MTVATAWPPRLHALKDRLPLATALSNSHSHQFGHGALHSSEMRQNFQPTPEKWHEAKGKIQAMIKWNEGAVTNKKNFDKKIGV